MHLISKLRTDNPLRFLNALITISKEVCVYSLCMRITFIETGRPPEPISSRFGDYPLMMADFFAPHILDAKFNTCSLINGERLPRFDETDAIVIMGSPHSVYDELPWIAPLIAFIREAARHQVPQIGICFGHQIIAKAMGGIVEKAPQGWGIGRHTYKAISGVAGMDLGAELNLLVSHQDQVLVKPDGAQILAHSDFTPNAALYYKTEKAISFQAHPEFKPKFLRELISSRRGTKFSIEEADAALASIKEPIDGELVGAIIAEFLGAAKLQTHTKSIAA